MNNRKILVLFLALATIFAFAPFVLPIQAAAQETAWLKVVTPSWNNPGGEFNPIPNPAFKGVGDRYNVTNAFVELYTTMPAVSEEPILLGTFRTNGTGFVQIKWPTIYAGWEVKNFTVLVHWKDTGIYIYKLEVGVGFTNGSILWDGSPGALTDPEGVIDVVGPNPPDLTSFATAYATPSTAWVAHAAIIFKDIQTFYADGTTPLGNTVIRVYENYITDQASAESLIYGGTADENGLLESVPIPLNLTVGAAPHLNGSIAVWWETVLVGFVNHTLPNPPFESAMNGTTNDIECNVFNATWEVYDNASTPQPLWGARIKVNVLPTNYLMHVWYLTDIDGLAEVILPNSTDNLRYCYSSADMIVIDTATFADDVKFEGLGIEVEWKGGRRNAYGGSWVLVNYTSLEVPAYVWDPNYLIPSPPDPTTVEVPVTASVYDIAFKVVDALGTPVDGAFVTVYRQNGPPITEELPGKPLVTGHSESDEPVPGFVFLHQLPGKLTAYGGFQAIYGVKVVYEGVEVYYNASVFKGSLTGGKLQGLPTQTTLSMPAGWYGGAEFKTFPYIVLNASIFKVKVHLADCNFAGLPYVTVNYTHPTYGVVQDSSDGDGNIDLVAVPGKYEFTAVFFKGKWASVVEGNGTLTVSKNVNLAVNIRFYIADIILTFYDFDREVTIPNLNATLSWIGTLPNGTKAVFEEGTKNGTLVDGTPYEVYRDDTRTKVYFKQMPSAIYNITVYTKVSYEPGDPPKALTPGKTYWPDKRLVYFEAFKEIKIDCNPYTLDICTWAYDWTLKVINGLKPLANVTVEVWNDAGRQMGTWVTDATGVLNFKVEQANYKTDTVTAYTTKRIWWNGTYTLRIEYKAAWDYVIREVFNASVTNQTAPEHKFKLQKDDHVETLKVPVGDIIIRAADKCGKPLYGKFDNATVELGIYKFNTSDFTSTFVKKLDGKPLHEVVEVNATGHAVWLHVPTAGWFNATQMGPYEVIKNFTVRVLWYNNSAVVYEKVWNMTKEGLDFVKEKIYCEVYNITFVTAICKDVNRPVKNLNVTIYWWNATNPTQKVYPKWWNGTAWIEDPAKGIMPWTEGKWTFVMIPGPKYFNVSENYYHVHVEHDALKKKGITELAYPGPMGTELSYLYWDPVEGEWLPDAPYCIFSGKEFRVGIKLNATDIETNVSTGRWEEEYSAVRYYPLYRYVVRAQVTTPLDVKLSFSGDVVGGKVTFKSGDTIDKVIWNGSTIDSIVITPNDELQTPASNFWRNWMKEHVKDFYEPEKKYVSEVPYPMSGATLELKDLIVNVTENDPDTGLHVPYKVFGNFTIVTVRVTDFNGRPLPGAFVELVELTSRKVSSWSYTDENGNTVFMNVTAGWPNAKFSNYIIRVYFLGYKPAELKGAIPIWPKTNTYVDIPVVYDTWEDEPTHKWIIVFNDELAAREARERELHRGTHSDVFAKVFDMRLSFFYEKSKPIDVTVDVAPLNLAPEVLGLKGLKATDGSLLLQKLVRGTYKVTAYWDGKPVATKTIDVSQVNVGTVYAEIPVEVYDLTLFVGTATGVPLSDAEVEISGVGKVTAKNGIASFEKLPTGVYTVTATWTNKDYGKTVKVAKVTSELVRLKETGKIVANVFDVVLTLVDGKARPISGATIKLAGKPQTTDVNGKAIFTLVPVDVDTGETVYDVSAEREGKEVAKASVTVSPTRTEFTILGGLYDLRVQVVGAAGQGLASSTVVVKRAGVEVATLTTDPNGVAVVPQLVASDYDVEVLYKGFSGSASISASDLAAGKAVVISLPPYAEV
ncbi:MAG: hypothetical protein QXK49_03945, partial [Candidatus Aenigmatarchaeota archaeon]